MAKRKKYLLYYKEVEEKERQFIKDLINVIIKYPVIWNNYIENIISPKYIVSSNDTIVIHYKKIDDKIKNIIFIIYDLLQKHKLIKKELVKNEFVILYLKSENVINILTKRNVYMKYIIANVCLDHTEHVYVDCKVKFEDDKVLESEVIMKKGDLLFIINSYEKHSYIKENISNSQFVIPIYYKSKTITTLMKNNLINYTLDYRTFKENFQNIVNKKIVNKSMEKS